MSVDDTQVSACYGCSIRERVGGQQEITKEIFIAYNL
jgi:hypothetical protein